MFQASPPQELQRQCIMETLNTQDQTLFLAYRHVMEAGMKQLGNQIYKLGVSAGLDLKSANCDIRVEEVIEAKQTHRKQK